MRDFFKSKTFSVIFSVLSAIILWIYVVYEVDPSYDIKVSDVNIKCINESDLFTNGSLAVTGRYEDLLKGGCTVSVKVKGKRNIVSSVSEKNLTCTLDMVTVTKTGSYSIKPNVESDISGVEIAGIEPKKIDINVEKVEQKDIEVKVKTMGTLPVGYTIENLKNQNSSVKITGSHSELEKIDHAEVVLDYSALETNDSEKSCKIFFYDKSGESVNDAKFTKTINYAKLTFGLYTTREITVVLMPKYDNEIKTNQHGQNVELSVSGNGTKTSDGGLEMKVKVKGTQSAIIKYTEDKRTVYTDSINVSKIFADTTLEDISAAQLANGMEYVSVPRVTVNAKIQTE